MVQRVFKRALSFSSVFVTALLLVMPVPVWGAAATSVRVLEQTPDRTVVRIDAGARGQWASFALAIPGPERPVARIVAEQSLDARDGAGATGNERVYVSEPGRVRGLWTASIHVPLEWATPSGSRRAVTLTVTVEHPSDGRVPPAPREDLGTEASGAFLNSTVADRLAAAVAARRAPAFVEDTFARSPNWLRIEVDEGGIYALDYAALRQALGTAADLVDPASLRLFSARHRIQPKFPSTPGSSWEPALGLVEHAIRVDASEATLAPGDRIVMFLPGVEGWADEYDATAGWLDHDENTWDRRHSFWLTWEEAGVALSDFDTPPRRMVVEDASPSGVADRVLDNVRVRTHAEENVEPGFGNTPDDWAWTTFIKRGESRRHAFTTTWVIPDSTAWIRTRPMAEINGARTGPKPSPYIQSYNVQYEINSVPADSVQWSRVQQRALDGFWFAFPFQGLASGIDSIRVRNTSQLGYGRVSPLVYVDAFDIHWRGRLRPDAAGHVDWVIPEYEATSGRWRYQVSDPAARLDGAIILDVSEPFSARWIEPGAGRTGASAMEFDVAVAAATRSNFRLSTRAGLRTPLRVEPHRPRLLRDEVRLGDQSAGTGYDYVVLTAPDFANPAEDLADLRRADLLGNPGARVAVIELPDVYDEFGHGAKDPAAMRNFIKFLYEVDPRLKFVALFGDANRDSRRLLPNSNVDWCPTWVESAWPANPDRGDSRDDALVPFARDDWFVSLDDPVVLSLNFDLDLPDLAIGRFPVNSVAEGARVIRMLENYVLNPDPGSWKNSILLAADDEIGGNGIWETYHIEDAAELIAEDLLPRAMDRRKLYLTEYVNVGTARSKPAARQDFIEDWSAGQLIVHYIGHGSPQQLADEVLFRVEDVGTLRNADRRPLFLALSCDVSIFDDPTIQSMSEALVLQGAGGAIASIAATYVTYVDQNEALTASYYGRLYPDQPGSLVPRTTLGRSAAIGTALFEAKVIGPPPTGEITSTSRKKNDAKYAILGDPALRLQSPREDTTISGALTTRIRSGQLEELQGTAPQIVGGTWDLMVTESADSVEFSKPGINDTLPYVLPGRAFFSGHGRFDGDTATATLRTPVTMRLGHNGRVRMLLEDAAGMSVALADTLPVEKGELDTQDGTGPTIEFENFASDQSLSPGAELVAVLQDSSGINVLGSVAANSILVEFDESGASIDFTDRFQLDESSYTRGSVSITLPQDLPRGAHSLTLSAGDMAGNVSLRRIDFRISDVARNGITRHAPFPNPFRDTTRFVVEVSSSVPGAVELTLDLYTVGGAHVQSLKASVEGSGRAILPWEGRDRRGDELANGTYLYVVRARFGGSPPFTETATGRVVLMR